MRQTAILCLIASLVVAAALPLSAQNMPASPEGSAQTQIGEGFSKWIQITYSRPILRGRSGIFGEGESYGQKVNAGAPVWRAGANVTTRLKTDVGLKFGETSIPAGEYSLFIDLGNPSEWTLLISSQPYMASFDRSKVGEQTWGSYGFDESKVVAKVPMTVNPIEPVVDQLTWMFTNVSAGGGSVAIAWDQTAATTAFSVE